MFDTVHFGVLVGLRANSLDDDGRVVLGGVPRGCFGCRGDLQLVFDIHRDPLLPHNAGGAGHLQLFLVLRGVHGGERVLCVLPDPRDEGEDRDADSGDPGREKSINCARFYLTDIFGKVLQDTEVFR